MDLNPSTSLRAGAGLTQTFSDGTNHYSYAVDRIEAKTSDVTSLPPLKFPTRFDILESNDFGRSSPHSK